MRYFIVSYQFKNKCNESGFGTVTVTTNDGSFLNYKKLSEGLNVSGNPGNIVVLNIIEVTNTDFNDYIK